MGAFASEDIWLECKTLVASRVQSHLYDLAQGTLRPENRPSACKRLNEAGCLSIYGKMWKIEKESYYLKQRLGRGFISYFCRARDRKELCSRFKRLCCTQSLCCMYRVMGLVG